jgi:NAD(P)-dependent dehydrogenase (short-subunit alcohol dehydrogenase family)
VLAGEEAGVVSGLLGTTAIVVGASRGLGRGIATAFGAAGATVIAVSRTGTTFPEPPGGGGSIHPEVADGGDATAVASLIDRHAPQVIIVVAGASPHMLPLRQQTWDTFSIHWQADVRIAFHWTREALLKPLRPGSRVVVFSSGAALNGSPLSGGYAGAKATQRFITAYAQDEADRAGLDIRFTAVMPRFSPQTGVGQPAVRAYAARAGLSIEEFLQRSGPLVNPTLAASAMLELIQTDPGIVGPAYLLTGDGLSKLS